MKKISIIILAAAAIAILCAAAYGRVYGNDNPEAVAYVNGEAIEYDEFMLFASKKKFEIIKYFSNTYNAEYDNDFWRRDYNGENPSEKMKEEVMRELVPVKLCQELFIKYGLADKSEYSELMKKLKEENSTRKKQKADNRVVYGVTEYTPLQYYEDNHAKLLIDLKAAMAEDKLKAKDEDLKKFYEENKDKYYGATDESEVIIYCFENGAPDSTELENLRAAAASGFDIKSDAEKLGGEYELCEVNSGTQRIYSMEYPELEELFAEPEAGYVSEVFKNDSRTYFAQILSVKENGCKPYEEVEDNVRRMYTSEKFEEYLNALIEKAKVRTTKLYENISFDDI